MAEGRNNDTPKNNPKEEEKQESSRKRKRNKNHLRSLHQSVNNSWEVFLESRITCLPKQQWPDWLHVENNKPFLSASNCTDHEKSALYHAVTVNLRGGGGPKKKQSKPANECGVCPTSWPLHIFAALRNLRCAGQLVAIREALPNDVETCLHRQSKTCSSLFHKWKNRLPPQEASILESKLTTLHQRVQSLLRQQLSQTTTFNHSIRLIMACDAVYYRLHYLQVARQLQPHIEGDDALFLPQPPEYFGLPNLTLDIPAAISAKNELYKTVQVAMEESAPTVLSEWWGMTEESDKGLFYTNDQAHHPLSALWQLRFLETIVLFHQTGWTQWQLVQKELQQATRKDEPTTTWDKEEAFFQLHESPAPPVLKEWRDSCRDFLCNIYAYATLSPKCLDQLSKWIIQNQSLDGLLELGAGTGYIAKLLQQKGVQISEAWDICPTPSYKDGQDSSSKNANNEYHGLTAPFLAVKQGKQGSIRRYVSQKNALLLCYPPPNSPMALEALQEFMQYGGQYFIHIGEFHGLTGSAAFEKELAQKWVCLERYPCQTWGTDASHVSIWQVRGNNHVDEASILLPCSHCHRKKAKKRCRLLRSLVYCGEECFNKGEIARSLAFKVNMIDDTTALDFKSDRHFMSLKRSWKI